MRNLNTSVNLSYMQLMDIFAKERALLNTVLPTGLPSAALPQYAYRADRNGEKDRSEPRRTGAFVAHRGNLKPA